MKKTLIITGLALTAFFPSSLSAQETGDETIAVITRQDSLFWQAYNTCEVNKMDVFFSDDVEFYHDKGGPSLGLPALVASFKGGICSDKGTFRLRREAVEGSVKVFPLKKNGVVYGAIISGEHVFYVLEKGKPERLDGLAKFTHLWMKKDGAWKMTRVLSYDHGPAPYRNKRKEITLSAATLQSYAGRYKGPQSGILEMKAENGWLVMHTNNKQFLIYPEKEGLFFSKERDLTFEFVKTGGAAKMIVRERGDIVEELVLVP